MKVFHYSKDDFDKSPVQARWSELYWADSLKFILLCQAIDIFLIDYHFLGADRIFSGAGVIIFVILSCMLELYLVMDIGCLR